MVVCGVICAQPAQSELITVRFTGEVENVDNVLAAHFAIGDTLTGTYTYDTSAIDTEPDRSDFGRYRYYQGPSGISLETGGFQFRTDPGNVDFLVEILNNYTGTEDSFYMNSYNNLPSDSFLGENILIGLGLHAFSGDPLSSDALPETAPVRDQWDSARFDITSRELCAGVGGNITSFELVPEPSSILLIGVGALVVRLSTVGRRRRKTIV